MGIFDFFRRKPENADYIPVDKEADELLSVMTEEFLKHESHNSASENYGVRLIKRHFNIDQEVRKKYLLFYSNKVLLLHESKRRKKLNRTDRICENIILSIFCSIIDQISDFNDKEIFLLLKNWHEVTRDLNFWSQFPVEKIFKMILDKIAVFGLTEPLRKCLEMAKTPDDKLFYVERRKLNDKIDFVLQGQQDLPIHRHDPWGPEVLNFIENIADKKNKENWIKLLKHALSAEGKSSPSQKWLGEAKILLNNLSEDEFIEKMSEWIPFIKRMIIEIHQSKNYRADFLRDINHDLFKALIWCTGFTNNKGLINNLDDYASWAYKKKPGVGSISAKTGTACMYAFSLLPFKDGMSRLTKFRMKIKNNTILKSIDKIIHEVSVKNGISKEELEELAVPDFGLDSQGVLRKQMGEFIAVFTIKSLSVSEWVWEKEGKIQKSIPATIKNNWAEELKDLKNTISEIESLLPVHKERIEQSFLRQKPWKYDRWKKNYLDHPLMGVLVKKLIWHFGNSRTKVQGIWLKTELVDVNEKPLADLEGTEVQLWHPIGFATEEIVAWRNYLQRNQVTQPFKQAFREIYILTDAELNTDSYSNRFAAHILRQHQFAALCKQRGWQYNLMGQWDSHNTPHIKLDNWHIRVEYFVDADWQGNATESGIFSYIATDQVRFYKNGDDLRMSDVPALVFTEIMRDIDLFVGVTSIGNDPAWQDSGNIRMDTYWREYSFGDLSESAKMRSDILKDIIPRLKISSACSFDGKYLLVRGKIKTYKIHMGSGNILMEPDDRYLCIVPGRNSESPTEKLFLPFEGDHLLSIILSKALLLTEDDKITDTIILRQIRAK